MEILGNLFLSSLCRWNSKEAISNNCWGSARVNTLAPCLFIIVLDYVLRNKEATTGLQIHPDELLPDLDFADDIFLLHQGEMEALDHFQTIESSAKKVYLSINTTRPK